MERIKELGGYQKFLLLLLVIMTLGFIVPYATTTSRVGYEYRDAILVPREENGATVYSGEIKETPASFTITADKSVTFQYGSKTYGPYTVRKDETAVPQGKGGTGVEVRCDGKIIFRGSFQEMSDYWYLTPENESYSGSTVHTVTIGGNTYDENGNLIDPNEPSIGTVLKLAFGPELTHKGSWWVWFIGLVMCVITAVSILFADELFRYKMSFRVRDAWDVEPSDWELSARYISWTLMPIVTLVLFLKGLQ